MVVSSVLVRRDVLGDERFDAALSAAADWDMWLRLASKTSFGFVPQPVTQYRLHGSNMSRDIERMRRDELRVIDRLLVREGDPGIRHLARRVRNRVIKDLGHCAYERRDYRSARDAFLLAWSDLGWAELRRLGASALPALAASLRR